MEPVGLEPGPGMPADVWRRFELLCAVVERNRTEIARARRLPPEVVEGYRDADLYRILVPADLGGAGLGPMEHLDLSERMAFHDASAGWNLAVGPALGYFSGFMPPEQVHALFARDTAAMAGSGAPQGVARRVPGGYRVSGRFSWASGIDQAHWVYGGCFVHAEGAPEMLADGRPRTIMAFAPKAEAVVHECWDVSGLVATNSTEFTLDDVFVPEDRIVRGELDRVWHDAALFRLPMTVFGFALTGVPLGTARRAVEGLKHLAQAKDAPGRGRLADNGYAQYAVGKAEALVEAGRTNLRDAFARLWALAEAGEPAPWAVRARVRRAVVHAVESSLEAVQLCARAAGGSALFTGLPFEAAVRDVTAMCGHLVFQRTMMEDAGKVSFGQAPTLPVF
ncbi:MAG: hypothetical protein V4579_10070 [Pseudomonadota bacterium]